ncbi:MAG: competence/damage-inducible protein A [Candidatus Hodarchaeales archaeon]|jgi:molybdenum cofactor synthesis domain-containing protein
MSKSTTNVLLISIGNELLSGQTVNTNASYLAKEMTQIGFTVQKIITIPDKKEIVSLEIQQSLSSGNLGVIIITGGLGPTWDDSTASFLAEALNVPVILNSEALAIVTQRYKELFSQELVETPIITSARKKMAYLPEGTSTIDNPIGTAPGIFYQDPLSDTLLYCLPGVPKEMKAMFSIILPDLIQISKQEESFYFETEIITSFNDESLLAPFLLKIREKFDVWIKSLPKTYQEEENIHLIFSTNRNTLDQAKSVVVKARDYLSELITEGKMK